MQKLKINNYIISILICMSVAFVSVGFSFFEDRLSATGIGAVVRVNADIRITNFSVDSLEHDALSVGEEYNKTNVFGQITLPNEDSKAIYNVSVTNMGNVEMGISSIKGLPDNLEYELIEIEEGKDKICENSICKNGATKNFKLVIKYKNGGFDSSNVVYNFDALFDFRYFLEIDYDDSIKEYSNISNPTNVMYGSTVLASFDADLENIYLLIGGKKYRVGDIYLNSDGSESLIEEVEGKIKISNVEDNIVFIYSDDPRIILSEESSNMGIVIKADWYNDNSVEFTLNGTLDTTMYTRLRKNDIYISASPSSLYKEEYALNPLFKANEEIYLKYTYLGGDVSGITETLTIKFRDTSKSSNALNSAEYITNHSKKNFKIDETTIKTAKLTKNVSVLSMYAVAGNTFNNYKFKLQYGYVKDLN